MSVESAMRDSYFLARQQILDEPKVILDLEQKYMEFLLGVVLDRAERIFLDFSIASQELLPFWKNYPPEQRGRQPTGTATPMLELGEKTLSEHLISEIAERLTDVRFPGLPTGGDIRFSTADAFIHFDIKITGPNDNPNELVVPPNQVSGDGAFWVNDALSNSTWPVYYGRTGAINYNFQPKLSPIYILDSQPLICLTFFLKAVYTVTRYGIQPLGYFELVCVPNGLLMFASYQLANTTGLIIAGKDDKKKFESTMRIRIRLDPLATIDSWRCIKILPSNRGWEAQNRLSS